jgi:hypothetical protein
VDHDWTIFMDSSKVEVSIRIIGLCPNSKRLQKVLLRHRHHAAFEAGAHLKSSTFGL